MPIKRDIGIQTVAVLADQPPQKPSAPSVVVAIPPTVPPQTRTRGTSTAAPPGRRTCSTNTEARVYSAAELQAAIDHTLHVQQQLVQRRQQQRKTVGTQHSAACLFAPTRSAHTQTPQPPPPPKPAAVAAVRTRNAATNCRPAQRSVACGSAELPPVASLRAASPLALMSRSMDSAAAEAALRADSSSSISLRSLMAMGLPPRGASAERQQAAAAEVVQVELRSVAVQCGRERPTEARGTQATTVESRSLATVGTQVRVVRMCDDGQDSQGYSYRFFFRDDRTDVEFV